MTVSKGVTFPQLGKVLIIALACVGALTGAAGYIESRANAAAQHAVDQSYPITDGVGLQTLVSIQQDTLKTLADNQKDLIIISQKLTTQMEILMELNDIKNKDD
jgi:hypothetical protein